MEFKFNEEKVKISNLEIEDIGNCCLEGVSISKYGNNNLYNYLLIKSSYGFAYILKYGPLREGVEPADNCSLNLNKIQFNQDKIIKIINNWLNMINDPKTDCKCINIEEFKEQYIDLFNKFLYIEGE